MRTPDLEALESALKATSDGWRWEIETHADMHGENPVAVLRDCENHLLAIQRYPRWPENEAARHFICLAQEHVRALIQEVRNWRQQESHYITEYAARCHEAREASTQRDKLWTLLRDAFGLIDGAECPVDSPEQWKADVRARMAEALRHKPWADRPEEAPQPRTIRVRWSCEHGHEHATKEGAAACYGAGQTSDVLPKLAAENVRLTNAIRDALEAAETEGVHVHRGTDDPREFAAILRKALK